MDCPSIYRRRIRTSKTKKDCQILYAYKTGLGDSKSLLRQNDLSRRTFDARFSRLRVLFIRGQRPVELLGKSSLYILHGPGRAAHRKHFETPKNLRKADRCSSSPNLFRIVGVERPFAERAKEK